MNSILIGAILLAQATTSSIASPTIEQAYSTTTLMQVASAIADQYHLNKPHFLATLNCESRFAYDAKGDDGKSIGIAQIYLKAHPDVTRAEALNPVWAMLWMANEWLKGSAAEWTCWRNLYGKKTGSK